MIRFLTSIFKDYCNYICIDDDLVPSPYKILTKMENKNIGIWFAVNKDNKLFLFTSEPKRVGNGWFGDFFLNSLIHDNIETMLKGSKYSFEDEPQYLEFKLTAQ